MFFHTYLRPRANPNARVRLFRKAIFLSLKTFVYSPLSLELPLVEVANYLVNLLRLANGKNGSYAEETKLGVKILKLLKADPNGTHSNPPISSSITNGFDEGVASLNLCKLLRILRLDGSGHGDVELIRQTTQRVIKVCSKACFLAVNLL